MKKRKKNKQVSSLKANSYFCFDRKDNYHQFKGEKNPAIGQWNINLQVLMLYVEILMAKLLQVNTIKSTSAPCFQLRTPCFYSN